MFDFLKNTFLNRGKYKTHSDAVIVSCFFNPQNSPYRLLAFQKFYRSIKHLNHRIIECLIGDNTKSQLPESEFISTIHAESLLWHKEALLNKIIVSLPEQFKYVFWLDADVLFTNNNWLVEGVNKLKWCNIIQPFEYCIHLEKNQLKPNFDVESYRELVSIPQQRHPMMWRSFCANCSTTSVANHKDYDVHGHVGFAWGAKRSLLEKVPLYDKALIGGADHIMAHAAAGHIQHDCIAKSFTDNIDEVNAWSNKFFNEAKGLIGFVEGDLYHLWHGDIKDRQYLKRIRDFTGEAKKISEKDENGLYLNKGNDAYMKRYYRQRECIECEGFDGFDAGFIEDMGYSLSMFMSNNDPPLWMEEPQVEPASLPMPVVDGVPSIPVECGGMGEWDAKPANENFS